jgi:hypothetical protein
VDAAVDGAHSSVTLLGRISILTHRRIAGWAWDPDAPDVPLWVVIAAAQRVIGRCVADQFREELAIKGIGKATHGFELDLQAGVLLLRHHYDISVRRESDGAHLPGSPYMLKPVFPMLRK